MTETTEAPQQNVNVRQALADLAAIRADRDGMPADAYREALQAAEKQLATVLPCEAGDLMNLATKLVDKQLARETREGVAGNLARMSPVLASRQARLMAYLQIRENSYDECRDAQLKSAATVTKALDMLAVARMALPPEAAGVGHVLAAAMSELEAARALQEIALTYLAQPRERLQEIVAEERAEAVLFSESLVSTAH